VQRSGHRVDPPDPEEILILRAAAFFLLGMLGMARAQSSAEYSAELEAIRAKHQIPALAALAMTGGEVRLAGAVGVRKLGAREAVTQNDKWHIGSCTKSMTATLAAMFVEQGKIRWDTKISEVFPEFRETMEPSWQPVTLEMLLTHRSGAPAEAPANLWRNARGRTGSAIDQRMNFVSGLLLRRTEEPPGTKYLYSNQGYAIAGAMLERVGSKPWEELMRTMVFEPCHMTSSGFGVPASLGKIDQPWGHVGSEMKPMPPGPDADNPPAIGPAGTVHCSLVDFARYAAMHALGERVGTLFLRKESFLKLHTPVDGQEYASGWAAVPRGWAGGTALTHAGSNTMFYFVVWIAPAKDAVFVAATNCAGKPAQQATDEAISALIGTVLK
jgi:CubicO group peptidase (beta-lactamase class C family)